MKVKGKNRLTGNYEPEKHAFCDFLYIFYRQSRCDDHLSDFCSAFFRACTRVAFLPDCTYAFRVVMLGLFLGAYPLAQFFLAPLLGDYADHHGRKKTLVVTTVGAFVGYVICGWSIWAHLVVVLFLGRLLMGASSGNLSICLTAIADVCNSQKEKVRFYTLGSVIAGFTFVLGPFLGGKLSDPKIFWLFTPSFPLFVGAFLTVLNVIFLATSFKETILEKRTHAFDLIKSVHNIQLAFKTPILKKLYLVFFFYLLSWNMLFQFVPAYLVDVFSASNSTIGDVSAILGGCWVLGSLVLKVFNRIVPHRVIVYVSAIVYAGLTVTSLFFGTLFLFTVIVGGQFCLQVSLGLFAPPRFRMLLLVAFRGRLWGSASRFSLLRC